jgi:2-polyprenyl-3-methyl-5-hydroxy-6-metoxy-1,4-benzoquinol methylase
VRCTSPDYGKHARIVQCNRCGFVYANPRWTPEELVTAYAAVEDKTYVDERTGRELTFEKHLRALERVTGPARGRTLLDVGAYIGVFVEVADQAGWDAYGVEPSVWAAREAQARGLQVFEGTQYAPALGQRRFDVVTMWDVIEHVDDPRGELLRAYALLKPGGVIAVHTMDIESLMARLMGPRWPWLMGMHINYFSQSTLQRMLQSAGFEVLWSGVQGRYLRVRYLATRVTAWSERLGQLVTPLVERLGVAEQPLPINLGDLFTVYARRPSAASRDLR